MRTPKHDPRQWDGPPFTTKVGDQWWPLKVLMALWVVVILFGGLLVLVAVATGRWAAALAVVAVSAAVIGGWLEVCARRCSVPRLVTLVVSLRWALRDLPSSL